MLYPRSLTVEDSGVTYRPHLDGIRGIAIALVLAQHFIGHPYGLGGVGVALFFALSGYLITSLLIREADSGRVKLGAFYARRAARLIPAIVAMVAVTAPLLATRWPEMRANAAAALTYTTNLAEIRGHLPVVDPYAHTWSLAIEEHFYLLWAPVLAFAYRRRGVVGVERAAIVGIVVATVWRVDVLRLGGFLNVRVAEVVLHGSLARMDALLFGCLLACRVQRGLRVPGALLLPSAAALAVIAALPRLSHPYWTVAELGCLSVVCTAFVGAVVASPRLQREFSFRPLVYLGTISYSLYVWHYPILDLFVDRVPRPVIFILAVTVSVASYYLIERPVRDAVRRLLDRRSTGRVMRGDPVRPEFGAVDGYLVDPPIQQRGGAVRAAADL